MGLSFAGGLALLAAADGRYAPDINAVVAVGAHDSLYRVAKFLVTGAAKGPDGTPAPSAPEQYGALVLVYEHPEEFFSASDVPAARGAIWSWLAEKYDTARAGEAGLNPTDKATLEALFRYDMKTLRTQLLAEIEHDHAEFDKVSPEGRLGTLHVPVFLLHGYSDSVIPSTETLWLAREIPGDARAAVLITPAMGHVDPNARLSPGERWQLINFMAQIFERLDAKKGSS
jgi:pimeloyl-ACP methyl ester carboxylesterase